MSRNKLLRLFTAVFIFMIFTGNVQAGEATIRIKTAIDKLIEIVTDHDLDPPEMAEKRACMIRETVSSVFDWQAFSQRALGRHWRDLNQEQKDEFVNLFGQLLERTYMDKTRQYSGQQMDFLDEKIDGKYGIVNAEVVVKNGTNIAVEFRVMKENEKWFIYDVYVEGVGLVNNYRVQFNNILIKSGYKELLARLKAKLDE